MSFTEIYAGDFDGTRATARAHDALAVFEPIGDDFGIAWAHWIRRWAAWMACRAVEAADAVGLAAPHARATGDQALVNALDWARLVAAYFGPTHLRETVRIAESLLVEHAGHEVACATVQYLLGAAIGLTGDHDSGRVMNATAIAIQREAGMFVMAAARTVSRAHIEMSAGDLSAAEQLLRAALDELRPVGDRAHYATVALTLADVLERQGRYDEAAAWCRVVRETTGSGDLVNDLGVDALEGYLSARTGDLENGLRLVRGAAERAAHVDFFWTRGLVYTALGKTLVLAGESADAVKAFEVALRVYDDKGDVTSARQTRELIASVSA
jgi:tetratricopeptide (TPR) repeat protein